MHVRYVGNLLNTRHL